MLLASTFPQYDQPLFDDNSDMAVLKQNYVNAINSKIAESHLRRVPAHRLLGDVKQILGLVALLSPICASLPFLVGTYPY